MRRRLSRAHWRRPSRAGANHRGAAVSVWSEQIRAAADHKRSAPFFTSVPPDGTLWPSPCPPLPLSSIVPFRVAAQSHAGEVHHGIDASGVLHDGGHAAIDIGAAGHVHANRGDRSIAQATPANLFALILLFGVVEDGSVDAEIALG